MHNFSATLSNKLSVLFQLIALCFSVLSTNTHSNPSAKNVSEPNNSSKIPSKLYNRNEFKQESFFNHLMDRENDESMVPHNVDTPQLHHLHRNLQGGDLNDLNDLLDGLVVALPDAQVTEDLPWPLTVLILSMSNIQCSHMFVGKIEFWQKENANNAQVDIFFNILDITIECTLDWRYEIRNQGIGDSGSATLSAKSDGNNVQGFYELHSEPGKTFNTHPPISSDVGNCQTNIEISDMDFDSNGISADILNIFESSLRDTVSQELEDLACDELSKIDESVDEIIIKKMHDWITPYFDLENNDPLYAEKNLPTIPEEVKLVNWKDEENPFLIRTIQRIADRLGSTVLDRSNSTGTRKDLAINILIRSYDFFDEDVGAVIIDVDDFPYILNDNDNEPGFILELHDMLTETTISWTQMRVFGLDTFIQFDPMNPIGSYTLQNLIEIKELDIEIDLVLDIKPSTHDSSVIITGTAPHVIEHITIRTGFRNIEIEVSTLVALDEQKVSKLRLGAILDEEKIMKCLLSTVWKMGITVLSANAGSIIRPVIDGFVDDGLDSVVNTGAQVAMTAYSESILSALPGIFQTNFRTKLNNMLDDYLNSPENVSCKTRPFPRSEGFVDLRDFLLEAGDASSAGGSGTSPYGEITPKIKSFIDNALLDNDPLTGEAGINEVVIAPITMYQSGISGTYLHSEDLFTLQLNDTASGMINADIRLYKARLDHVDSLSQPMGFLQPIDSDPYILNNGFSIGTKGKPLIASARLLVSAHSGESLPIGINILDRKRFEERNWVFTHNEMDFSIEFEDIQVLGDFLAKIDEGRLRSLPIHNVWNINCWLSTIPAPELNSEGLRVDPLFSDTASLSYFAIALGEAKFRAKCSNCTSVGFQEIPSILSVLELSGTMGEIIDHFFHLLSKLLNDAGMQSVIDRTLQNAKSYCDAGISYNGSLLGEVKPSWLQRQATELGVFYSLVLAQVFAVASATEYIDGGSTLPILPGGMLGNENKLLSLLTKNDTSVEHSSDGLLKYIFDYFGSNVSNYVGSNTSTTGEDLGINAFFRSLILDENGAYYLYAKDFELFHRFERVGEFSFSLTRIGIIGLDSFTNFNATQLSNSERVICDMSLRHLSFKLEFSIDLGALTSESQVEFFTVDVELQDVDIFADLTLSIGENKIRDIQLGSIFHSQFFLPCLMSAASKILISELLVTPSSMEVPTVTGYISVEIENAIRVATEALHNEYKEILLSAVPIMGNTTVRKTLNKMIRNFIVKPSILSCPSPEVQYFPGPIDFRDLLMDKINAASVGARGNAPYGDMPPKFKHFLDTYFFSADPSTGLSQMNDFFIRPVTESQSGTPGTIFFSNDILNVKKNLTFSHIDHVRLKVHGLRIDNLDSIVEPFQLIEPRLANAYTTDNEVMFGSNSEPLLVSTRVNTFFGINDSNGTQERENEMEISVKLGNAHMFAALMAKVDAKALLSLSLNDSMNPYCWLSTIPVPMLSSLRMGNNSDDHTASINDLKLHFSETELGIECLECSSKGLLELPSILSKLESAGIVRDFFEMLISFFDSLISGDWMQSEIYSFLEKAGDKCAGITPKIETEVHRRKNHFERDSPVLHHESLEMLVYSMTVAAEVFATVVAIDINNNPIAVKSYEKSQVDLVDSKHILSFSDMGDLWGFKLNVVFDHFISYLGSKVIDAVTPAREDLGINVLLRSMAFDNGDELKLAGDRISFDSFGLRFSLESFTLQGLDTFSKFDLLQIDDNNVIKCDMELDRLDFILEFAIKGRDVPSVILATRQSGPQAAGDIEYFTVKIGLNNLRATVSFILDLEAEKLGNIALGSFMESDNVLPCLLSAVHQLHILQMNVTAMSIDEPNISGFISQSTKEKIGVASKVIFRNYESVILQAIPFFFQRNIRDTFNSKVEHYLSQPKTLVCPVPQIPAPEWIDFRDLILNEKDAVLFGGSGSGQYGDVFPAMKHLIDNIILANDPKTMSPHINDAIPKAIIFDGDILNASTVIENSGFVGEINLKVSNVRINNMDSLGRPLHLFDPLSNEPYTIINELLIGYSSSKPLQIVGRFFIEIEADNTNIRDEVDISIEIDDAHIIAALMLVVNANDLLNLTLRELKNPYCLLATISAPSLNGQGVRTAVEDVKVALTSLSIALGRIAIQLDCIECTSPGIKNLSNLLSTDQSKDNLTRAINQWLLGIDEFLGGKSTQINIDRLLNEAHSKCKQSVSTFASVTDYKFASPVVNQTSLRFVIVFFFVLGFMSMFIIAFALARRWLVNRNHTRWLKSLTPNELYQLHRKQLRNDRQELILSRSTRSMIHCKAIPLTARILMPIVVVINIGLFMSGHLSLGASVNVYAVVFGEEVSIDNLFEFSMAKSIIDMWNAGAHVFAVVILIFSGIWPYTKQFSTLILWIAPPSLISVSLRGSILGWLDAFAKWSVIDIFVLVISIAGFRLTVTSPQNIAYLSEDLYSFDMMVVPLWGLYANMIAQLISQISSHYNIYYHHKIVKCAINAEDQRQKNASLFEMQTKSVESSSFVSPLSSKSETITDRCSGQEDIQIRAVSHEDMNSRSIMSNQYMDGHPVTEDDGKSTISPAITLASSENIVYPCALRNHEYSLDGIEEGILLSVRHGVDCIVGLVGLLTIALITIGFFQPSFHLDVLGILGLAVESGQGGEKASEKISIFSLVRLMMSQARALNDASSYIGLSFLSIFLVLTSFTSPVLQTTSVLVMWYRPMTASQRKNLHAFVKMLKAWQYLEIYLISIVIATWNLGDVSAFMIDDYCDGLNDIFNGLFYYGFISASDAQCYYVRATLVSGAFLLFCGAVLLSILTHFITKAADQQLQDTRQTEVTRLDLNGDDETVGKYDTSIYNGKKESLISVIRPVPLRVTDIFRFAFEPINPVVAFSANEDEASDLSISSFGISVMAGSRYIGEEEPTRINAFLAPIV